MILPTDHHTETIEDPRTFECLVRHKESFPSNGGQGFSKEESGRYIQKGTTRPLGLIWQPEFEEPIALLNSVRTALVANSRLDAVMNARNLGRYYNCGMAVFDRGAQYQ